MLEALERFHIREVLDRYFNSIDAKDAAGIAACFAEDATMTANCGSPFEAVWHGAQAIGENIAARWMAYGSSHHALSNLAIRLSRDTAEGRTFAIAYVQIGGSVVVRGLRYDDLLVKRAGHWTLLRREHRPLWQSRLAAVPPVPAHLQPWISDRTADPEAGASPATE